MDGIPRTDRRSICVALPWKASAADTFIQAHIANLPANVVAVHGWRPTVGDRTVLSLPRLALHKLWRTISRTGLEWETTAAYLKVFRRFHVEAVLAEYGDNAVHVIDACRRSKVPLIAHFHGYDASVRSVLEENANGYKKLFEHASAIVVVSRAMQGKLFSLGAPPEKVHLNPYGVDCKDFSGGDPKCAPPLAVAVGRFVEKKAPQKALSAFAAAHQVYPAARLRMIGDGPLLNACRDLASELGLGDAVTFLGAQDQRTIQEELRLARCFVQHSVEAPSGDSEGTPVAVIEASATGVPVVATRHAGIPDVVVEGVTGLLVDEGDVAGMAQHLVTLFADATFASELGRAARRRAQEHFSIERSLGELWRIIESCIQDDRRA